MAPAWRKQPFSLLFTTLSETRWTCSVPRDLQRVHRVDGCRPRTNLGCSQGYRDKYNLLICILYFSNVNKYRAQVGKIVFPRCDLSLLLNPCEDVQHVFQRSQKVPKKLLFCQDHKVKVKTTSYKLTTIMTVPNKCSQTGPTYYHMGARCIWGLKKIFVRK